MKATFASFIVAYILGTEAFESLKDCSFGKRKGICTSKSDCFAFYFSTEECGEDVCCLETMVSHEKCLEYAKMKDEERDRGKYRIIGGTVAKTSEFPFMVAIGKTPESNEQMWFCGGSIISENFILTAAHCVDKKNVNYMILAGTTFLDSAKSQLRYSEEVIIHPKFFPWKMGYDLALIRVSEPFQFSSDVFPICLISSTTFSTIGRGLAAGYGVEKAGVSHSLGTLKKVMLDIFTPEQCNNFYPAIEEYGGNKPSILCAGVVEGGKDTCQGDSGGPLSVRLMKPANQYGLIGVTSAGVSCGLSNSPGLYIKVPYFLSWIEKNVWIEDKKTTDNKSD